MQRNERQPASRFWSPVALALIAGAAIALLGGCGREEEAPQEITISHTEAPYQLDPAYAHTGDGFEPVGASEVMPLVYTPLLTYRRAPGPRGSELIPGLAQDLPEISEDGRTYLLAIRDRLEYSDGTVVRASDFEHAVKRVLLAGSPVAKLLEGVEGVDAFLEADDPAVPITGIAADDETGEIAIEISEPDASFSNVLASWALGLVPSSAPLGDESESPPPGVGPYEIAESLPGERFVLAKSERFGALDIPDIPTGNLDTITVEIVDGVAAQARDVLDNRLDYMPDSPPPSVKSTLLSEAGDRYQEHAAPATYLFALDPRRPPFDDPRVREAANLAVDRRVLARAFDGELEAGCSFLPPQVPGYDEDLDTVECPYGDVSEAPQESRARRIVEEAGATGAPVVVWGSDAEGVAEASEAYAEMLSGIGLDAKARVVPQARYLRRLADGEPGGEAVFLNVFLDFPHPLNAYTRIVGGAPGRSLAPRTDSIDDPHVSVELERLNREPDLSIVAEEWAELDRHLVSPPQSHIAPIGHPTLPTFVSDRLDIDRIVFHPVFLNDYATFVLAPDANG